MQGLRFSPNGKSILLTTNGSLMRLLDAFNGHPLQTFAGHLNNKGIPVDGCFSPDSKVLSISHCKLPEVNPHYACIHRSLTIILKYYF